MDSIAWINSIGSDDVVYGPKATNLSILSKKHAVPNGFCIISNVLCEIINSKKINELKLKLNDSKNNIFVLNQISKNLRADIVSMQLPEELQNKLHDNYRRLNSKAIAVRLSSSLKDQEHVSFTGQFDTYLNIGDFEQLIDAVKKCRASFFDMRSIIYRMENKINNNEVKMSVMVQDIIDAEYSGVLFTNNIDKTNTMLCEVVSGMCENLVLGKISPGSYALSRDNLLIFEKREEFEFDENIVKDISSIGLEIEKELGQPQDIEWCIDKDKKVWILQSRPITAMNNKCSIER